MSEIEAEKQVITQDKLSEGKIIPVKPKIRRSLLAKKLLVRGENSREFEELQLKIMEELLPQTKIEQVLCEKIISAKWKLDRLSRVESKILSDQNQPKDDGQTLDAYENKARRMRNIKGVSLDNPSIQSLLRHQAEIERNMYTALKILRKEQNLRLKNAGKSAGI